jgi:hypothetical protein
MRLPRPRFTVRRAMFAVACIGICLAGLRVILLNAPIGGLGTIYSEKYDKTKFESLRDGMTAKEVEAIMGEPLKKVPWNQHMGVHDEEMWFYSDQPNIYANYWRRWVHFQDGKTTMIINDYWKEF